MRGVIREGNTGAGRDVQETLQLHATCEQSPVGETLQLDARVRGSSGLETLELDATCERSPVQETLELDARVRGVFWLGNIGVGRDVRGVICAGKLELGLFVSLPFKGGMTKSGHFGDSSFDEQSKYGSVGRKSNS